MGKLLEVPSISYIGAKFEDDIYYYLADGEIAGMPTKFAFFPSRHATGVVRFASDKSARKFLARNMCWSYAVYLEVIEIDELDEEEKVK